MYSLVITEKPSVAQSISAVLGATQKQNGCLIGNRYIVSWCFGHLLELVNADAYDAKYAKWKAEDLPILPEKWKHKVSVDKGKHNVAADKAAQQVRILGELMKRDDVDSVICATDAGREGELIFRLVYNHCKCKKPIKRLWISSMEDNAIVEGFKNLREGNDYNNLYIAADSRSKADWLVGINGTRLFSVLYNSKLSVGRVQTPTLAMLVERARTIEEFLKKPFYVPELEHDGLLVSGEKHEDIKTAETICTVCNGKTALVTEVKRTEKSMAPPKLYDLTTLQREANKAHGYTAQQTLDCVQSLYEMKLATYPRTDSQYITTDMQGNVQNMVNTISPSAYCDTSQIADNSKVSDHHAILPTATAIDKDNSELPVAERNILHMLVTRLLQSVGEKHIYAETVITVSCEGHLFTAKGKTVIRAGWQTETEYKPLPGVEQGYSFTATATIREGSTSPPKHYTDDTLLAAMETAGKDDMPDDAERKGLGTPATRAGIIENMVKKGYIERKGKDLRATQTARILISIVPDMLKSPLLTAEWEHKLKSVEHGELTGADFIRGICDMVRSLCDTYKTPDTDKLKLLPKRENGERMLIGICPRCGGNVYENQKYNACFCDNRDCKFALYQDNGYFQKVLNRKLDAKTAIALLKDGFVNVKGLVSKAGKSYDATVVMSDDGAKVNFSMKFEKNN